MNVYQKLGVNELTNISATLSLYGGSRMKSTTFAAMREATNEFVDLFELEEAVGREIAKLTKNEAAFVTCGASSALLLCSAICMAGDDAAKLRQLPDTTGMKNEFIALAPLRNVYDFSIQACGGKVITAGHGYDEENFREREQGGEIYCSLEEIEACFTEKTCAVFYADLPHNTPRGPQLKDVIDLAHAHGVPIFIDAAAELPPVSHVWYYTEELGADAAIFSGGKHFFGPQHSGVILGKKNFVEKCKHIAFPNEGIIRSGKVGREEIVGLYTAIKAFMAGGMEARLAYADKAMAKGIEMLNASGMYEAAMPKGERGIGQGCGTITAKPIVDGLDSMELAGILKEEYGLLIGGYMRPTQAPMRFPRRNQISINMLMLEEHEFDWAMELILKISKELVAKHAAKQA